VPPDFVARRRCESYLKVPCKLHAVYIAATILDESEWSKIMGIKLTIVAALIVFLLFVFSNLLFSEGAGAFLEHVVDNIRAMF
jgi:hypothetical protein